MNSDTRDITVKRKRQEYFDTCLIYNSILEDPLKNMNESELKTYKQISVDVPRTMTEYKLFTYDRIRKMMLRLLYVWSKRHPAAGYVQGFNDLCTPFITVFISNYVKFSIDDLNIDEKVVNELSDEILMEVEADSYWCFTKMMDRIQTNYINNQPGLQRMMKKMEEIINRVDTQLARHIEKHEITFMQFSFRWMNCYLMREFPLKLIIRIWDTYFSEEDAFNSFHLFVCACLLLNFSENIKKMQEFQDVIMFLQNLPMHNWTLDEIEVLLAKSYQIHSLYGSQLEKDKN